MVSAETQEVARRAEDIYDQRLRAQLEKTHRGWFVTIDPDSGDYYLGRSIEEAAAAARQAHPDRLLYTLRVGHKVAVEIGNSPV